MVVAAAEEVAEPPNTDPPDPNTEPVAAVDPKRDPPLALEVAAVPNRDGVAATERRSKATYLPPLLVHYTNYITMGICICFLVHTARHNLVPSQARDQ